MSSSERDRLIERWTTLYGFALIAFVRQLAGISQEDAEECVQETFLHACVYLARGGELPRHEKAWLFCIARHVLIDLLRKLNRTHGNLGLATDLGEVDSPDHRSVEPCEAAIGAEQRRTVGNALGRLSDRERTVIEGFMNGESQENTARKIGRNKRTIQRLFVTALGKLRRDEGLAAFR